MLLPWKLVKLNLAKVLIIEAFFIKGKYSFNPRSNIMSDAMKADAKKEYWQANVRLVIGCIVVWFIVSYGAGILFVDALNGIRLGGYKLGFWFAQQGSIYTFVCLIFFYAWRMNQLDKKFNVHEE